MMATKKEMYNFCKESSIRGLSRAAKANTRITRLLWTIAVVVGGFIAIWYITNICIKYSKYEVFTTFETVQKKNVFPAVTVCNLQPFSSRVNHSILHSMEVEYVKKFDNITGGTLEDSEWLPIFVTNANYFASIRALFQNLKREDLKNYGHSAGDLVVSCQWEESGEGIRQCELMDSTLLYHPDYLLCYKFFRSSQTIDGLQRETKALRFTFFIDAFFDHIFKWLSVRTGDEPNNGVILYLHLNDSLPDFQHGIRLSPGYSNTVDLEIQEFTLLGEPYTDCTNEEYITHKGKNTAFRQDISLCTRFCCQQALVEHIKCILPDYPYDENLSENYPFCGNLSEEGNIANLENWWTICDKECANKQTCTEPCHSIDFKATVQQSKWPHASYQLQFYDRVIKKRMSSDMVGKFIEYKIISELMKTNVSEAKKRLLEAELIEQNFMEVIVQRSNSFVTLTTEHPAITGNILFGTVGGLFNLWIGISFVTVFELMDMAYRMLKRRLKKKNEYEKNTNNTLETSTL